MSEINSDKDVMEFFPNTLSHSETQAFIKRMRSLFDEKGFCYFAVDTLVNKKLIGFIGLCEQDYGADITPCVDIGWRLKKSEWNKGYATEGAYACLDFAFYSLGLKNIYAVAPLVNSSPASLV